MDQRDLLLDYLHQGKEKAYELLYHYYYVPLVLFAGKYVGNEEVAKDIVQEFFISLLDKEMAFDNRIALKVYLYTGVRNKSLNYLRHLKIRRQYEMKMLEEGENQVSVNLGTAEGITVHDEHDTLYFIGFSLVFEPYIHSLFA